MKIFILAVLIASVSTSLYRYILDPFNNFDRAGSIEENGLKQEYIIFIEIQDKTLYLLRDGVCIKKYPIASGRGGLPSPIGCWKVIEKGKWGESFGGRWLGLNVPWGIYGIHGTENEETIGTAASHGCIRMYKADVKELYSMVPMGTEVAIVNGSFGPFGIGFADINPGDTGADVLEIQRRLKQLNYYKGELDAIYEDEMKAAVHQFQRDHGLKVQNTITREAWLAMGFKEFE